MSPAWIGHRQCILVERRKIALTEQVGQLSLSELVDAVGCFCQKLSVFLVALRHQIDAT